MTRVLTAFLGAIIEAWAQLRIGKVRVMLSLVGVGAAVAAMTFVIALGQVAAGAINKQIEASTGRPGTVAIEISPTGRGLTGTALAEALGTDQAGPSEASGSTGSSGSSADGGAAGNAPGGAGAPSGPGAPGGAGGTGPGTAQGASSGGDSSGGSALAKRQRVTAAQSAFIERYGVTSWATNYSTTTRFGFPEGGLSVKTTVVSRQYGIIHHTKVAQGRWFSADDEDDLSPSIIVSQSFLDALGVTSLDAPLTVQGFKPGRATYTIVGVLKAEDNFGCYATDANGNEVPCASPPEAMVLAGPYERGLSPAVVGQLPIPTLEVWAGKRPHLHGDGAPAHPRDRGAPLLRGDEPPHLLLHHAGVGGGDRGGGGHRDRPGDRGPALLPTGVLPAPPRGPVDAVPGVRGAGRPARRDRCGRAVRDHPSDRGRADPPHRRDPLLTPPPRRDRAISTARFRLTGEFQVSRCCSPGLGSLLGAARAARRPSPTGGSR